MKTKNDIKTYGFGVVAQGFHNYLVENNEENRDDDKNEENGDDDKDDEKNEESGDDDKDDDKDEQDDDDDDLSIKNLILTKYICNYFKFILCNFNCKKISILFL